MLIINRSGIIINPIKNKIVRARIKKGNAIMVKTVTTITTIRNKTMSIILAVPFFDN